MSIWRPAASERDTVAHCVRSIYCTNCKLWLAAVDRFSSREFISRVNAEVVAPDRDRFNQAGRSSQCYVIV